MDVEYELDVDEINRRWEDLASVDLWSQMVIKETGSSVERITDAAQTGQWYLDDAGELRFRRAALDWHQLQNENECFFLRIYGPGDYRWKGADLGVLVTKGRLQEERPETAAEQPEPAAASNEDAEPTAPDLISSRESESPSQNPPVEPVAGGAAGRVHLTDRGQRLIDAIRSQYAGEPLEPDAPAPVTGVGVKSGW